MTRRRKRQTPEQIVRKLRDVDAILSAGKDQAAVLHALEVSQATLHRERNQSGRVKSDEAKRLKQRKEENRRLQEIVAEKKLDHWMLRQMNPQSGDAVSQADQGSRSAFLVGAGQQ